MLPTPSEFAHFDDIFYDTDRAELFSMSRALPTIINAGMYRELANSFLIVARQTHDAERIYPLKIIANNCPRKPQYQLRTEIHRAPDGGLFVKKIARNPLARQHLKTLVENCKIFSATYGAEHVAQMKLISDDAAEMEFIDGVTFEDYVCEVLAQDGAEAFVNALTFYFENILRGTADNTTFSNDVIDFNLPNRRYEMDLNFRNIIVRDDDFVLFDYEFLLPTLPKKFVAWRAFRIFYHNCANLCQRYGISLENLAGSLDLSPETEQEYQIQNLAIANAVSDVHDLQYRKKRVAVKGFKFD